MFIKLVNELAMKSLMTFCWNNHLYVVNEPQHDKTNKMTCAPSEESDQPGHPPSLIRIFTVSMKKIWIISYPLIEQRRLIRLGGHPG